MKKTISILVLLLGFTTIAQKGEHHGDRHADGHDMTPEQMATLHTKKMTLALDLSDNQQGKIYQMNLGNAQLRKEKMEERKSRIENEARQKPTSDERFAKQNQHLDHQIAQKEKVKQILTSEQFEKWEMIQLKKRRHHKKSGERKHKHGKK